MWFWVSRVDFLVLVFLVDRWNIVVFFGEFWGFRYIMESIGLVSSCFTLG